MLRSLTRLQFPDQHLAARRNEVMAHRRRIVRGRLGLTIVSVAGAATLLLGSVYVADQTTRLRNEISRLEADCEVLHADYAQVLQDWNTAVGAAVITQRGVDEAGLVPQPTPDVVVALEFVAPDAPARSLARFLEGVAGGQTAHAATLDGGDPRSATPRALAGAARHGRTAAGAR
jgi:hypothetical protein